MGRCANPRSPEGDEAAGQLRRERRVMPEGLSATEVGKEIGEHAERHAEHVSTHDRVVSIVEAILLSIVTITAAWSGYSAAKWSTESSLSLAKASATRSQANRAFQQALTFRSQDAANFNAWFSAYLAGDKVGERVAEKRFRPEYDVAFRAWLALRPFTNPHAPKGARAERPAVHAAVQTGRPGRGGAARRPGRRVLREGRTRGHARRRVHPRH